MAYVINDNCINCGVCVDTCPVSCIHADGSKHKIDPDACISCGACAPICPVDAISE